MSDKLITRKTCGCSVCACVLGSARRRPKGAVRVHQVCRSLTGKKSVLIASAVCQKA